MFYEEGHIMCLDSTTPYYIPTAQQCFVHIIRYNCDLFQRLNKHYFILKAF